MRAQEIFEANISPDKEFLAKLESGLDAALEEYEDYLSYNDDIDNIEELADLLSEHIDEDLRMDFLVNDSPTKSGWWMSAEAASGETDDGERVTDINITLNADNMAGAYGPKTFKKMFMRLVSHELVHKGQHAKVPNLYNLSSGFQKAATATNPRDWERTYLRDPHELMAYGETLAQEIADTANPGQTIRNPEAFRTELPTYEKFRKIFPRDSKQIKALLKYTSQYL